MVYTAQCNQCTTSREIYIGESSRTLFTRCAQHVRDFRKAVREGQSDQASSWIKDHLEQSHKGSQHMFNPLKDISWKVKSSHRDPLSRQTTEAVLIQEAMETGLMPERKGAVQINSLNRKGEYFCARERWDKRN